MVKSQNKKVLLIGWDAADWKIINPLLDAGRMPALESLVNHGVIGKLATLEPTFSPMLWTSIATGKTADKHGILGFIEPTPEGDGIRPVNVTSRKVRALWNILNYENKWVNLVNWWPSYPAEPLLGVVVSNNFPKAYSGKDSAPPAGIIHPAEWVDKILETKIYPENITDQELLNFVPNAAYIDQDKDSGLVKLSVITAENLTVYYSTLKLMQETDWDLTAAYFGGIDQYCHQFMKYHPPMLPSVNETEFELYKEVINAAYVFHDKMLARLLEQTDENTVVILISDHGFHSDHLRAGTLPDFTAAAALEHSPYGIICMAGPGIKEDERIYGASILDITPTILAIFGIPVAKDMDGKPLLNAFKDKILVPSIESWEIVTGNFYTHAPILQVDTFASVEALRQLVELGYIEEPDEDIEKAISKTIEEAKYNLSRTYLGSRRFQEAMPILEELFSSNQLDIRFNLDLLRCYIELRIFDKARELINNIDTLKEGSRPSVDLLKGMLLIYEKKYDEAIELLQSVEKRNPGFPNLQTNLGNVYLKSGMFVEAIQAYQNALDFDDGNAGAFRGLAICHLRLKKYEEAAEYALSAIGLFFNMPLAHYHLGEALFYLKKYQDSAQAFELSLKMAPDLYKARLRLVTIYRNYLNEPEKAEIHTKIVRQYMKGEITIVSGLPRSGTSMLMQMLKAGGLDILTDNIRQPDENNPNGYLEYAPVKNLKKDQSFLAEADGKVVKVITQLLKYLPDHFQYKVIFVNRDMHEILASQQKMIGKAGETYSVSLAQAFEREIELVDIWALKEPNVEILYLNYKDVIYDTDAQIKNISGFIGKDLDESKMKEAVHIDLYRNKLSKKS